MSTLWGNTLEMSLNELNRTPIPSNREGACVQPAGFRGLTSGQHQCTLGFRTDR